MSRLHRAGGDVILQGPKSLKSADLLPMDGRTVESPTARMCLSPQSATFALGNTVMTDRPIIFSGEMICALLAGNKTMTRRLALRPNGKPSPWQRVKPGDRLWVREAFAAAWRSDPWSLYATKPIPISATGQNYVYQASWARQNPPEPKWRPSIHMPRWASRLTLTVTATKIERLQDISEADAQAEGIARPVLPHWATRPYASAFRGLWNDLHGPGAWEAGPEVVALTFTVAKANIDAKEAA